MKLRMVGAKSVSGRSDESHNPLVLLMLRNIRNRKCRTEIKTHTKRTKTNRQKDRLQDELRQADGYVISHKQNE